LVIEIGSSLQWPRSIPQGQSFLFRTNSFAFKKSRNAVFFKKKIFFKQMYLWLEQKAHKLTCKQWDISQPAERVIRYLSQTTHQILVHMTRTWPATTSSGHCQVRCSEGSGGWHPSTKDAFESASNKQTMLRQHRYGIIPGWTTAHYRDKKK
jgi:hypothetical protein